MTKILDYIEIQNLEIYAHHGVFKEEKEKGQTFFISAKLYADLRLAGTTDDLNNSTNYGTICHYITKLMTEKTFDLIEAAGHYVATEVLLQFTSISSISLKLSKPNAPVNLPFENISVNLERGWHTAHIALGSNMGNREDNLKNAVTQIRSNKYCDVMNVSSFIETKPYGYTNQDDFLNGAIEIKTLLSPYELLDYLHEVENKASRTRTVHWGPRTLDLDIIFYDDLIIDSPTLVIPHPEMEKRDFVLNPLKQISPYKVHPILNMRIQNINPQ